jgi:pimeloyl-ACP methyl ester carboxylesterase
MSLPNRRQLLALAGACGLGGQAAPAAALPSLGGPWTRTGDIARAAGRVHFAELGEGSGPPLILLPKLGGWIADWRGAAPALAARRRVIAIDPPGHGGSVMLGPPPYIQTPMESAAMILAALDDLGIDQADVAGNSLGGAIAIAMAVQRPRSIRKLALVSVSLAPPLSRAQLLVQDAEVRPQFGPHWEPLPRTAAQTAKFASLVPAVNEEQNQSRAAAGVWVRPSERGVGRFGVTEALSRVTAPVLVLYGDRGHYVQFEEIARQTVKDLQVVKVSEAGSFVHQEKPEQTAAILNAFLNG